MPSKRRKKSKPSAPVNVVLELIEAARQVRGDDPRPRHPSRVLGLTEFARDMSVSIQAVQKWIATGVVPHLRVGRAEEITRWPRHRIRPDLWPPPRGSRSGESSVVAP